MERKLDKKLVVLKMIYQNSEEDKNSAINECSLMQKIDSPYVLNCEEVYLYNNEVFMFL